jgi:hypothetical protein
MVPKTFLAGEEVTCSQEPIGPHKVASWMIEMLGFLGSPVLAVLSM